ncbi:MAG TPA: hypothetical protein VJL88_02165 [Nitrospira sp.]|nr:hypothetical protein [Nitrospira sp.]
MKHCSYILMLILLSGCGGFRGGIESSPYVEGQEPQESRTGPPWSHELTFSDLTVELSLNNRVRTYQYEVMLFVIPTYLNFWEEFQHRDADALELTVRVTAHGSTVTLDPRHLRLTVEQEEFRPTGVWMNNLERERQVIDTYVDALKQASADRPPAIPRSSEWRDPVMGPVTIHPGEKSPRFIVTFPVPLPSPERPLSLDLNPAISDTQHSNKPLIRFKSVRWSEGYS